MKVPFVDYVGFLEAALDLGIALDDGIKEVLDNSVDADSQEIRVILMNIQHPTKKDPRSNKPLEGIRIFVADDGVGIPEFIHDEHGNPQPGLAYIMSFGGRERDIAISGRKRTIGKFGWGLSATVACLARERGRAVIWSKQQENAAWRSCSWDYQDLMDGDCFLEEERGVAPPFMPPDFSTGTIVMIDTYEGERKRIGPIQKMLVKHAGRTYRHRMADGGLNITISHIPEGGWANGSHETVLIRDPLCRIEGSVQHTLFDSAKPYDRVTLRFDGEDSKHDMAQFGRIEDDAGNPVEVHIDVTWMPKSKIDMVLFDSLVGADAKERDRIRALWGYGIRGQGFSFIRSGREIVQDRSQGLYRRHHKFNYMHGEVHFPSELDNLFGIQQNKSRFGVDARLKEILSDEIDALLREVRVDVDENASPSGGMRASVGASQAENDIRKIAAMLPTPLYNEAQFEEGDALREEFRSMVSDRLRTQRESRLEALEQEAMQRKGTPAEIEDWKNQRKVQLEMQLEDLIEENEMRWKTKSPVRFMPRAAADSDGFAMYDVETRGDECVIHLQRGSPLIDLMQSTGIKSDSGLNRAFEILVGALGYAEHQDCTIDSDQKAMWNAVREDISRNVHDSLEKYRDILSGEGAVE